MAISLVLEIANITNIMLPGFPFLGPRLLGNGFSNFKMFQGFLGLKYFKYWALGHRLLGFKFPSLRFIFASLVYWSGILMSKVKGSKILCTLIFGCQISRHRFSRYKCVVLTRAQVGGS